VDKLRESNPRRYRLWQEIKTGANERLDRDGKKTESQQEFEFFTDGMGLPTKNFADWFEDKKQGLKVFEFAETFEEGEE
jgi:hypothetical protein